MTVLVAKAHADVQRLVSIAKMATVFEDCTTEEQRSTVRFCGQKDSMQTTFINKGLLFMLESMYRVKRFHLCGKRSADDEGVKNGGAEVAETTGKLLCCGFRSTGKAMGQAYQCWWRIY
jgi:hypothetical protein